MFSNLVESGSHAADFKRRGSFFAGALAFYALLLAAAGVGSVYAYNAHLDAQTDLEVYAILRFQPPAEERAEPERPDQPRPAAAPNRAPRYATRPEISHITPYHSDRIARESTREVRVNRAVIISNVTSDPEPGGGLPGPAVPGGNGHSRTPGDGPRVIETTPPPPLPPRATPTPAPAPKPEGPLRLTTSVINSKAVHKPIPPYPQAARVARIHGLVAVSILVDEQGRVVSAKATSGNPLLHLAAVQAARQARFTPTMLNGQPVRVTGVITYNFTLE
jgi:periplasmic protein TonB